MTSLKKRKEILSELRIEHKCNKKGDRPLFQGLSLLVLLLREIGTVPLLQKKGACPLFCFFVAWSLFLIYSMVSKTVS